MFLVWGFVFPYRDYLSVSGLWVFDFACMPFFFRVLHVYFRVLSVCLFVCITRIKVTEMALMSEE